MTIGGTIKKNEVKIEVISIAITPKIFDFWKNYPVTYCQYDSIAVLTKIPMLKWVYLVKSWYNWCFLRRQCSGSVGASRAGNPEGGGSSWVGGKVVCWWKCEFGGYVRLGIRDWEGAASFF